MGEVSPEGIKGGQIKIYSNYIMPYRKAYKYIKKQSRNKMDPLFGAPARVASLSKDVRLLKSIINSEKKYHDRELSLNITTTPNIVGCTEIAEGTDNNERVGRVVKLKSVHLKGFVRFTDDTLAQQIVRIAVVADTENNGSAPSQSDIFENTGVMSFRNMQNSNRFRFLYDKMFYFTKNDGLGDLHHLHMNLKKDMHINWSGSLGTNYDKNNIFLIAWASADTTTNVTDIQAYLRVRYYDN